MRARSAAGLAALLLLAACGSDEPVASEGSTATTAVAGGGDHPVSQQADPVDYDHWHEGIGFFQCDHFVFDGTSAGGDHLTDGAQGDTLGIHTHGDGVIHIHPFSDDAGGRNARMALFFDDVGIEVGDDSVEFPDGTTWDATTCPDHQGSPSRLVLARWDDAEAAADNAFPDEVVTEDFGDARFTGDRGYFTFAIVPEVFPEENVPVRPGFLDELDNLTDVPPSTDETSTSSTTTTAPSDEDAATFAFGSGACPAEDGTSPQTLDFDDAPQQCIDAGASYTATFSTTEGTVVVALDTTDTPGTANNFAVLSRYHYFDGTRLFRTDPSIGIIQGGSPHTEDPGDPGPGYDLPDEGFDATTASQGQGGPYRYTPGDLVMARSQGPDSAGAQFFFCVTDSCSLLDDQGVYVVFGHVTEGLDVLESVLALHVETGSLGGEPSRAVTIDSVTIAEG